MKLFPKSVTVIYPCDFQANRVAGSNNLAQSLNAAKTAMEWVSRVIHERNWPEYCFNSRNI